MTGLSEIVLGVAGFALAVVAFTSACFAFVLTMCGTWAFWSWLIGGPGFVAMCLS